MWNSKLSGPIVLFLVTAIVSAPLWIPVEKISTHLDNIENDDTNPQIAVDGAGNSYIVWEGFDRSDYEIYWVKIGTSGVFGDVKKISNHIDNEFENDHNPQIAVDDKGNSYVVWEGHDGNDYEIYWVKITSSGASGSVEKISAHKDNIDTDDIDPQIAVDGEGNSYVVWRGFDRSDYEIYWVKIASGVPGDVEKISTHQDNIDLHDQDPSIAVDGEGSSYVVWRGFDGNDQDIYWARITSSGVLGDVEKISHIDTQDRDDLNPQIAVDDSGSSLVTWEGQDGNDYEIYWVRIASGVPGDAKKISNHIDNDFKNDFNPDIAVDGEGNSYVVWRGYDGNDYEIYWVKINTSGVSGSVEKISNHKDNIFWDDANPQIAVDDAGNSHITWEGFDGIDLDIYWLKISFDGIPGNTQKISTHKDNINGYDRSPQIGVDASGEVYIVWEGFDGNDEDIYFTSTYTDSGGPRTSNVSVTPNPVRSDSTAILTADISDSVTGGSTIKAAEYFIDNPGENGKGIPMLAVDGQFNSSREAVKAVITAKNLTIGVHTVYVHGQDAQGNWGSFRFTYFRIYRFSPV